MIKNPIICALDVQFFDDAKKLIAIVDPYVGMYKLGLELFCFEGDRALKFFDRNKKQIFLDLKFHDIPNTVGRAVRAFRNNLAIKMITVHAAGEKDMIKAAVDNTNAKIIAVTRLTSVKMGVPLDEIKKNTYIALSAGARGVVCPAVGVRPLREEFGDNFIIITPGIRLNNNTEDDHAIIGTPVDTLKSGANYLVIGRPISEAVQPHMAAKQILNEIEDYYAKIEIS